MTGPRTPQDGTMKVVDLDGVDGPHSHGADPVQAASGENAEDDLPFARGDDGAITLPLKKPVRFNGADVDRIVLAEPTGKQLRKLPTPFRTTARGETAYDIDAAMRWGAALSGLPESVFDDMSAADLLNLAVACGSFFND